MKKKVIAWIAVAALSVSALTGCGSKGADDKKSFTQADVKGARVIFTPGASLRNTKKLVAFASTEKKSEDEKGGEGEDDRPVIE